MEGMKISRLMALSCALVLAFAAKNGTWPQPADRTAETPGGLFEGHGDVGAARHPGSVEYDAAKRSYTIAGSGENMWFATDVFNLFGRKFRVT